MINVGALDATRRGTTMFRAGWDETVRESRVADADEGSFIVRESGWGWDRSTSHRPAAAPSPRARFTTLTPLALSLIRCVDRRRYDDISVSEVKGHLEGGTIFPFLADRLGKDLALSLFDQTELGNIADAWLSIEDTIDERRKFGVENKGLCLLVAYLVEMMQHPSAYGFELPAR
jgi:hypothetical protein